MSEIAFEIRVQVHGDKITGAEIGCDDPRSPLASGALIAATEHMMTAVAAKSSLGFEAALQLLCEGARKNTVLALDGRKSI